MAVRELEKVVKAMSRKVIHLEEDIVMIKDDNFKTSMNDPFKVVKDFQNSTPVSEKKEIISDGENKSEETNEDQYKCKICDYKCKKEVTLHKHINTKHISVKCNVCFKKFVSTLKMLQHMAKEHNSIDNSKKVHTYDEVISIKNNANIKLVSHEEKDNSLVFSDGLDEFL